MPSPLSALAHLKTRPLLLGTLSFLCVFAPGLCAYWVFSPETVRDLDTLKLMVLAASVTMPLVFVNAQVARVLNDLGSRVDGLEAALMIGLAMTSVLLGAVILVWYLLQWGVRSFTGAMGLLELALCLATPALRKRIQRKEVREQSLSDLVIT